MNKRYLIFLIAAAFAAELGAQVFWAAGYTENLDAVTNGRLLIEPFSDEVLTQDFDSPVQFESTMAGVYAPDGEILFYTNGCHIYGANHEIIPGGENLNPGEIHDLACDDYGYLAPKGASIATFRTRPDLYFLVHLGVENTIVNSISYGPLYLTRIQHDTLTGEVSVLSKNEVLIAEGVDPFELVRHANGNDWWLLTNTFGTDEYHKILLSPEGAALHETQNVGYDFPFPPCRWQRSLSASPSGERLVRFNAKCGAQYLTFDRCSGELTATGFSHVETEYFGGGGSVFSANSDFVYLSRWYRVSKVAFDAPPDTLRVSFQPPPGFGGSFAHLFRDPFGRIYIAPSASEPYLHVVEPGDDSPDTAMVAFEGLMLPHRIQRTIPHYPNYLLGPVTGSVCDTLMITSTEDAQLEPVRLRLYPNPASELTTLEMDFSGHKQLLLYDALGRLVKRVDTEARSEQLLLADLRPGVYLLQVYQDERYLGQKRLVKF